MKEPTPPPSIHSILLVFIISALLSVVAVFYAYRVIFWLITTDGVIPLTEMVTQVNDQTVAPRVALTSTIMNAINNSIQLYKQNFGWQFISYPRGTLAVLNIPQTEDQTSVQYVMNTITGESGGTKP